MAISGVVDELAAVLASSGRTVAVAESCTGGGVAAACTAVAGSSAWFEGGVVSYSNAVKKQLLGVSESFLNEHGAVSAAVVEAMATGICERLAVGCAIATSGIAGPTGGSAQKPVGTVWIATAVDGQVESLCHHFEGDRQAIQQAAVEKSLLSLLQRLTD